MNVPKGFRVAGVHCGLKQDAAKEDLTLVVCDGPAVAAGVYTENIIYAAPVAVDRERTPSDRIRAVVVNSGVANACTGERGLVDARRMASLAEQAVSADPGTALVMSTGVIGKYLPMDRIESGIRAAADRLGSAPADLDAAARGILTTDQGVKMAERRLTWAGDHVQLTGIAKGAGMIGPRMATMLGLVMTDARLDKETAQRMLRQAVDVSFNCISVEGHMSTNDTVLLLAGGAAGDAPLDERRLAELQHALNELCIDLARQIPDDGEGATHLIRIRVSGCDNDRDARIVAKTIASSNLVKTAVAGADPNWGRIVSAAGYAGVSFDPAALSLSINERQVYRRGAPVEFDEAEISRSIREQRETTLDLTLGEGPGAARFWTSDLTVDYVRFNADYHT